eukprot:CAMPEP_0119394860 /NCGR_PEP_ID=MMETSP1334-20130426/131055_1 /TAXON_ID=127549 /ORGANISM="Calcidiscus leptoporus, Strain RCC1130" /LENGTH=38 /DNA_ID= /DNA_START= /DNA_END= /DNA_ORIENTATION=
MTGPHVGGSMCLGRTTRENCPAVVPEDRNRAPPLTSAS